MPCTLQNPLSKRVCSSWSMVSGQLRWTPWGEGFLLLFVIWFIPIHTRKCHPLFVGHSDGVEYKGCYLGSLCYIRNALHMCKTPQKHCGISLLYEQGHSAEVLGKIVS